MVKVTLKGVLGEKFGAEWNLNIKTPNEALRAIAANNPVFRNFLVSNKNLFLKFIINGRIGEKRSEIFHAKDLKNLEVIPVILGSLDQSTFGIIQILVGAVLIAGGIVATIYGQAWIGIPLIMGGLGLLASGVITLLTPVPKYERRSASGRRSSLFDSAAETAIQGSPVPLIYGELLVDALPVTSSIKTQDDNGQQ